MTTTENQKPSGQYPDPSASQVIKEQASIMAMLKENHNTQDGPRNLYNHLAEVLSTLCQYYPEESLQRLEEVSYLIKNQSTVAMEEFIRVHDARLYARHDSMVAQETKTQIEDLNKWFDKGDKAVNEAAEDEEGGPPAGDAIGFIPDICSDNRHLYTHAGIGFGEYGAMLLQKSLKALVIKTNATNLRFWGKIRGTEQDYFVAEVTADAVAADEEDAGAEGVEKHGEGVNALTYFVTNSPEAGSWTALPDLKPEHLQCARETKYAFSGHLDRKVFTNPFIHFQEKFLLRAAISRITATTNIQPAGVQRLQEDSEFDLTDNVPEDGEGPVHIPTTSQMKNRNMWCHSNRNILKCNRVTHAELPPPEEEGVEMEDLVKAQRAKDPYEARLKPISLDTPVQGGMPAWVIRHHGDANEYTSANPLHPNQEYGVITARSLLWPGAVTFFHVGRWTQIYVGNGQKHEAKSYYPVNPPTMMADPVDKKCYAEPNPTEEFIAMQKAKAEAAEKAKQEAQD